ncbi:diguanylate cyclase domain-containing protein [Kineococcus sp. TBRC 1896]|uniref:Diguanylate cyclase domain-containing protein n=1 Tax=Kineococcus mangrovi TaxID=1660183 RepID=A0ABV4I4Z1_9ACTN
MRTSTSAYPAAPAVTVPWDEALERAGVALALLHPAGHVAAATGAYCRLTGEDPAAVVGTPVLSWWGALRDRAPGGALDGLGPAPTVAAVLAVLTAVDVELDVELHEGPGGDRAGRGVVRVQLTAAEDGGAVVLLREVSAEHAERAALRARLAQQEAVIAASPDTIYRLDLGVGHVEWSSTGGACLLGLPAADDPFPADLVHPEDLPGVRRAVEALHAAAPGEIVECTYRVVDGQGQERWVHTRSTVTDRDGAGRALRAVGIAQDLTETITTMDALAGSERRFHEVFARGPVGMVLFGLEGWISEVNDALGALLERDTADLVGTPAAELLDPPAEQGPSAQEREERAGAQAQLQRLLDGTDEVAHRERRFDLPSGRTVWAQVTLSLTSSSTGEPAFLAFVEDVTARKREAEQLEHAALHDPLTGLPNRAKAEDRLGTALARTRRRGGGCAVLFVDLDHFKDVNDSLGHAAGDDLLREVADRLRGLLRTGDVAARIGGDEFVLVCEDVVDARALTAIAERVCERITIPVDLGTRTVTVTASVGAARTDGALGPEELLRAADRAMYRAKAAGRACWRAA